MYKEYAVLRILHDDFKMRSKRKIAYKVTVKFL